MGRKIKPSDLLDAARRDPRQLHLEGHYLSGALPAAVEAHQAAIPDARANTRTVLDGTYNGPAARTLGQLETLVAEAKSLPGNAKWRVLGLRDSMDALENPMDYPACGDGHKIAEPKQKDFEF